MATHQLKVNKSHFAVSVHCDHNHSLTRLDWSVLKMEVSDGHSGKFQPSDLKSLGVHWRVVAVKALTVSLGEPLAALFHEWELLVVLMRSTAAARSYL